jgi:hypothetical protein
MKKKGFSGAMLAEGGNSENPVPLSKTYPRGTQGNQIIFSPILFKGSLRLFILTSALMLCKVLA